MNAFRRLFMFEMIFNGGDKHFYADLVVSALGQYQVSVCMGFRVFS